MSYRTIELERRGLVALVTLNRPEDHNAVNPTMLHELARACDEVESDDTVRVVVITGAGSDFAASWDLAGGVSEPVDDLSPGIARLASVKVPVIAAVNGPAISAGLDLALACDIRIASERAEFAYPEVESGMLPLGGGMQRLARVVGRARALSLLLLGERLSAGEALQCGLVSRVTANEEVLTAAVSLAETIALRGPLAVKYAKEAITRGLDMPLEQALRFETDLTVILQTTGDRSEGVRAFLEKRGPRFQGE